MKDKLPVGAGSPNSARFSDNDSEFRGFEEVARNAQSMTNSSLPINLIPATGEREVRDFVSQLKWGALFVLNFYNHQ